jgi:hypothetical protein
MKGSDNYVLTPEQEKELYKRLDEHEKGETKYISSRKVLEEIRAKIKKSTESHGKPI